MKRMIAIALCGVLLCSAIGCGKEDSNTAGSSNPEVSATPEAGVTDPKQETNDYGMPMQADSMLQVVQAMVLAAEQTGLEYAVWNHAFAWEACQILVQLDADALLQDTQSQDVLYLASDQVEQCMEAIFAGYDGATDGLFDIPEGMGISYDECTDCYGFEMLGESLDAQNLKVLEWEATAAGGIEMEVALVNVDSEKLSSEVYEVLLTPREGAETERYHYAVSTFEKEETEDEDVPTEGAITKEVALTLIEAEYGKDGVPDPDTGNIIGYTYEGIMTFDGEDYYNYRMTWLVMDENGEADHSSYLQNVFVSLDGDAMLEGFRGADGWELMED